VAEKVVAVPAVASAPAGTVTAPVILTRMGKERDGVRWGRVVVVLLALLVVNLPYGLHLWSQHRVATDGVRVTASVVDVRKAGDDADVSFRFPKSVDADQKARSVRVHPEVAAAAARTGTLEVRVLKGQPDVFRVDGQVQSKGGLVLVVVADALILVMLLLTWRLGGRLRRPTLLGIAVEDVRTGDRGSLLDKQDDGTYLINGEVASIGPSTVVLTLRDRDVEIQLRDHENPVAVGGRAQVRAQLVG
jgi:hypothetical protein